MYGKVFESMYDGTLRACWEAITIFPHLIVLANDDGVVDMTADAIHYRTGIPVDIIERGIEFLEKPDPTSRSPEQQGRRLERLDNHRPWGWSIVNYQKYRDMASREDKKRADRERIRLRREGDEKLNKNNNVAECRNLSHHVADVAYTDTDTDTDKIKRGRKKRAPDPPEGVNPEIWADFVQHRKDIRKTLSDLARTKAANLLRQFTAEQQRRIVDYSISGGYPGLFAERADPPKTHKRTNETPGAERTRHRWTDTELSRLAKPGESRDDAIRRLSRQGGG